MLKYSCFVSVIFAIHQVCSDVDNNAEIIHADSVAIENDEVCSEGDLNDHTTVNDATDTYQNNQTELDSELDQQHHRPTANTQIVVRFENHFGKIVSLWWDDGRKGLFQGDIADERSITLNTFEGHRFFFTDQRRNPTSEEEKDNDGSNHQKRLYSLVIEPWTTLIQLYRPEKMKGRDREFLKTQESFLKEYHRRFNRTWQNYYPRRSVKHWIYNASYPGQTFHTVSHVPHYYYCDTQELVSNNNNNNKDDWIKVPFSLQKNGNGDRSSEFLCRRKSAVDNGDLPRSPPLYDASKDEDQNTLDVLSPPYETQPMQINHHPKIARNYRSDHQSDESDYDIKAFKQYFDEPFNDNDLVFEMKVLCHHPKIIEIPHFISDAEIDHLIHLGKNRLKRSTVAQSALITQDRTSQTGWIEREESPIINDIVRRIGDVTRMDSNELFLNKSAESLQLVHYYGGELYKSHYDYGTDMENTRFITFLMYLNTPGNGGGNTSFPLAAQECKDSVNGGKDGGDYFAATPEKGKAVFFYNLFRDGNVDDRSLHYAEPPVNGTEKYMTNLWIWDPWFGE